jgi:hypothetical protein
VKPGTRETAGWGESGSSLIVALVLLLAVGPILAALTSLTGTNVISASNLQSQRGLEFGANAVVEGAIAMTRHQPPSSLIGPSCGPFPNGPSSYVNVNGFNLLVECQIGIPVPCTNPNPTLCGSQNYFVRNAEFDACVWQSSVTWASCHAKPVVVANVVFNDVSNAPGCTTGYSTSNTGSYCYGNWWGTGMTIASWVVQTANG